MGRKIILFLVALLLVCSCTTTKYITVPEYHSDTVRISSHDTIIVKQHAENISVPLPIVKLSNVTKDTVSILTDGLYKSISKVHNGILSHFLETLPNAKVNTNVHANDTLKIHNTNTNITKIDSIPKPYPVVKDKIVYELHWYQTIFIWIGVITSIILGIYIVMYLIKKGFIHL